MAGDDVLWILSQNQSADLFFSAGIHAWSCSKGLFEEAVTLRLQGMREWWKEFSSNYRQIWVIKVIDNCPLKLFLCIPHYWRPSNLEWNPPIHASCQKNMTLQLRFSQYWRINASSCEIKGAEISETRSKNVDDDHHQEPQLVMLCSCKHRQRPVTNMRLMKARYKVERTERKPILMPFLSHVEKYNFALTQPWCFSSLFF